MYMHTPFTFAACACVGYGSYQAGIALAIIGLTFAVVGITERLTKK